MGPQIAAVLARQLQFEVHAAAAAQHAADGAHERPAIVGVRVARKFGRGVRHMVVGIAEQLLQAR